VYNRFVTAASEKLPAHPSRWEKLLWPRWLPVTARMPLVAQISGAVALTALVFGPWWARVPEQVPLAAAPAITARAPAAAPAPTVHAVPASPASAAQIAHLNLDVTHSFRNVRLAIAVDGKPVLDTALEGSGKRFKVFGKRSERSYTKTLELSPGVRIVRVRVRSAPDKFDQTRVERFDLSAASVAALHVAADKSGLTLVAERPAPPGATGSAAPEPIRGSQQPAATPGYQPRQATVIEFLHSLRSMLIGIAGFVASTATAFVVQEWLRSRRSLLFVDEGSAPRRRRRRVQSAIAE
jgi:hypothetical protein